MSECVQQFEVWDSAREKSQSVHASTLNDLIMEASAALGLPVARVCLEQDGTEVDEEEYFATLEGGTALMVLTESEQWMPFAARYQLRLDERPSRTPPAGEDFEELGNMDPDYLTDIVPDRVFAEAMREACLAARLPATQTTRETVEPL